MATSNDARLQQKSCAHRSLGGSSSSFRRCYGSAYTARETRLFAQALNLTPCFTPVASPQSNGMSAAFVKTLKRDYIRISALPDAEMALRLIDGWIEDLYEGRSVKHSLAYPLNL